MPALALSKRETGALCRLLGTLQQHIECAIDSDVIPGEESIALYLADPEWRQAEDFRMKLLEALRAHS